MAQLSERERISLLMMRGWGNLQRSYRDVRDIFNRTFRNNNNQAPVSISTISRTIERFTDTGRIVNRLIPGRPAIINEDVQLEVAEAFIENPHLSLRKASAQLGIPKNSVHRVMKSLKFHPYKIHLLQELNEDDPDRRIEFCETMMNIINDNALFLQRIVFSDESTFTLHGEVNRQNCRYWADNNPRWMKEQHTQRPQKVNVWAGIINETIIGPFFIDGDLNAEKYENMLRNEIIPKIREVTNDDFASTWFQQDGAPAHYGRNVRAFLDEEFQGRWIGRRGTIEWPAQSPDLTPLDFFLWGYLKGKIYQTKPDDLADLRNRIVAETAAISPEMIRRATSCFYDRLALCQEVNGLHFEHLLK